MPRPSSTKIKNYKKHQYSGPYKNVKRVLAGLRKDGQTTRAAVWRNPAEDVTSAAGHVQQQIRSSCAVVGQSPSNIRTYSRQNSHIHLEATFPTDVMNADTGPPPPPAPLPMTDTSLDINWPEPDSAVDAHILNIEPSISDNLSGLSGNRIVNLKHVLDWAFAMEHHTRKCPNSQIQFVEETRKGLLSTFTFRCTMCNRVWKNSSDEDNKINKSFVWASVTAGSYYAQAAHLISVMDIPSMTANTFHTIETALGEIWQDHLTEEIKKAGMEEKAIAMKKEQIDSDGVPYTTVYVDGGWLKRSYGHNFNSPSGMACIMGKETQKCLFVGVRNKYCYMCQYNERKGMVDPKPHMCWRNFTGASTAMEANILVEGFQKSEEMHGLRYLSFIGDGDSSVYANLREKVSYGRRIKKIECKNHVVKNYTSALYKILGNTKLPIVGRNILKPKLTKLTVVTRKIIMHNTNDPSAMRTDLRNGPLHVFGKHENCREYYCKWKNNMEPEQQRDEDLVEKIQKEASTVWALIIAANESVLSKAGRLSNETTNVAENFMSVINKFNCGKRLSLAKAGSYQRRVHVAGLSHTTGFKWHLHAWKKSVKRSPGVHFKTYVAQKEKSRMRRLLCPRKRLFAPQVKNKPDEHYGPEALDPIDIDANELLKQCEDKLKDLQKTLAEIKNIEAATVGQHENDEYDVHRNDRLTASQFGMICKRRNSTPCHNHVKQVLYKNSFSTSDTAYGIQNELVARNLFSTHYKKNVRQTGLFIDEEYGYLGASPDGLIEEERAIVEIKCFPSLARTSEDILTAAKKKKNFPLHYVDGSLIMNKKHNYYYQIQGQLRVTNFNKCYFVAFIAITQPLTVVEVHRDEEFLRKMMPQLASFYKNCILPEIILRRVRKNDKCKELKDYIVELGGSTSAM